MTKFKKEKIREFREQSLCDQFGCLLKEMSKNNYFESAFLLVSFLNGLDDIEEENKILKEQIKELEESSA